MPDNRYEKYEAVVIGASAGGLYAVSKILESLPEYYSLSVMIVQHRSRDERTTLEEVLQHKCKILVKQADEKEFIKAGTVYFAPADYHLLVEKNRSFSLSSDTPVNFSRPSIDVLFETAAESYKDKLIGIILTGANSDGARGIKKIYTCGGVTIAQHLDEAQFPMMPQAAIKTRCVRHVFGLKQIVKFLLIAGEPAVFME